MVHAVVVVSVVEQQGAAVADELLALGRALVQIVPALDQFAFREPGAEEGGRVFKDELGVVGIVVVVADGDDPMALSPQWPSVHNSR